jgi:chitodextrinase
VTGYKIYRNGTQIATATTTSYSNTGLAASTTYTYTVSAYDAAGNVSGQSAAVSATTQAATDTQAPSVPAGVTATAVSSSQINLTWTASTDNVGVTGYKVFRNGSQIATVMTTSYSNTGLAESTFYSYTVSAYDAAENVSGQSASASATTKVAADTQSPTVPASLLATAISTSQINLSWTASSDNVGVTGYKVYRNGTRIATTTRTSYSNTRLKASKSYTYTISAYDAAGNVSGQSVTASATTQAKATRTKLIFSFRW